MGRISNTIGLVKVSWGVLRKDRELLVIPVLSFLISIVVLAVLWVPTLLSIDMFIAGAPGSAAFVAGIVVSVAWGRSSWWC